MLLLLLLLCHCNFRHWSSDRENIPSARPPCTLQKDNRGRSQEQCNGPAVVFGRTGLKLEGLLRGMLLYDGSYAVHVVCIHARIRVLLLCFPSWPCELAHALLCRQPWSCGVDRPATWLAGETSHSLGLCHHQDYMACIDIAFLCDEIPPFACALVHEPRQHVPDDPDSQYAPCIIG